MSEKMEGTEMWIGILLFDQADDVGRSDKFKKNLNFGNLWSQERKGGSFGEDQLSIQRRVKLF